MDLCSATITKSSAKSETEPLRLYLVQTLTAHKGTLHACDDSRSVKLSRAAIA